MQFQRFSLMNGDIQLLGEQRLAGPVHVVFAHGWISSRRMWHEVLRELDPSISATAFDFRGCGESDRTLVGHNLDGYASDLRCVLASIPGPVTLVGHSMGARIAQYVATAPPANLDGLLLVAPGVACTTVTVPRHRELTARAYGSRRRILAFQRGAMARNIADHIVEKIVEDALIAQREHWFGWYDQGRTLDFSRDLQSVILPVEVVAGGADPLIPVGRVQREVVDLFSGVQLTVVPDAGHNLAVEAPQIIVERIVAMTNARNHCT